MINRRQFLKLSAATGAGLAVPRAWSIPRYFQQPQSIEAILDPITIPKYEAAMVIPPVMPDAGEVALPGGGMADYYEIAVEQFTQDILPPSMGLSPTPVWSYGVPGNPDSFFYPAFTIEADYQKPTRVKWINGLVDDLGNYRPHLLWVDQTVHWANPPGPPDMETTNHAPYTGPVPIVTHLHGAETHEESDGYPEAWYLPNANNLPLGYVKGGTFFEEFKAKFAARWGVDWEPGTATFQYRNDQRATTLWFHDHSLGITRVNVYAGPAGFYLLRGGPDDLAPGILPGPAPAPADPPDTSYYEIPIVIQDRSFSQDGSLFYPANRAFFEGLEPDQLRIPFEGDPACDGQLSDVSPIWNPEFFGNTIVVNGRTWPYLEVEKRRYRFRFLNGSDSRFLLLKLVAEGDQDAPRPVSPELTLWQIGADGGFLPAPTELNQLLMGPAERADVIVDFTEVPEGTSLYLINEAPDEPFGGGVVGSDYAASDPATTGQVMRFDVGPIVGTDTSTDPASLILPTRTALPAAIRSRKLSLNEDESTDVRVITDAQGNVILACDDEDAEIFGPIEALLGTVDDSNNPVALKWDDAISETPTVGDTEIWELYNFTADAHPIHVHLVQFEILNRQALQTDEEGVALTPAQLVGDPLPPESWETGTKDTVIAYPGQVTRFKIQFNLAGLFVWHCHILEHEDNEMMRPYRVMHKQYLPS
ncbi:MAG: multicopper oxidase domain-containing protein, partial [Anaerolineae bacterium]